jgi:hypothetical protein
VVGLLASALLGLAGCVHRPGGTGSAGGGAAVAPAPSVAEFDPLLGGPPLRAAAPSATPTSGDKGAGAALPAAPNPTASTAALAAGPAKDKSRDKDADPRLSGSPAPEWRGQGARTGGTVLHDPEPLAGAEHAEGRQTTTVHPPVLDRAVTPAEAVSTVDSYQEAQRLLAAYGVTYQSLRTVGEAGEWEFSCEAPLDAKTSHPVRAVKAGENGLAAIRAALQQLEIDLGPAGTRRAGEPTREASGGR